MKLIASKQILETELDTIEFDSSYFSSGYEARSIFIDSNYRIRTGKKNILIFNKEERLNAIKNREFYSNDASNVLILSEGESESEIIDSLSDLLIDYKKTEVNILIDYSSMTSVWLSTFLIFFRYSFKNRYTDIVNLYFCYSHSEFTSPVLESNIKLSVDPLNGFSNISIPDKPTALIIGLGYERDKATGLSQYLDAESYVFYTDSSYGEKFGNAVKTENAVLLGEVKAENIFQYPILNLNITAKLLHTLILDLIQSNRIVLAPCGPKIFTLLCLIESIKIENTDVWRISSSKAIKNVIDKKPDGKVSIYKVSFAN